MARKERETDKPQSASDARTARLKAALKANMAKRKAQARARTEDAGANDAGDEGQA